MLFYVLDVEHFAEVLVELLSRFSDRVGQSDVDIFHVSVIDLKQFVLEFVPTLVSV